MFTAFTSSKKAKQITGRLVVRRIPEPNRKASDGQPTLFNTHRHDAFFTTMNAAVLDTVAADKTHRQHAIIEQVNADLKYSALAHMPSAVFPRELGLAGCRGHGLQPHPRRRPPCRRALRQRIRLHLPEAWPWQTAWEELFTSVNAPPQAA